MIIQILNTIYELNINKIRVTKAKLLELNIREEEINNLLQNNLLITTAQDTYTLAPIKELFQYGKNLLISGHKKEAHDFFLLCYKIKPKHRDTCLQLFYYAVNHRNYTDAFKYLYALENVSTQEHLRKDYKIYLFLLSFLTEVPKEYQEKLDAIKNDKNLITHKKPNLRQKQDNKIITLVQKGKYKFAIESLNDYLAEDFDYEVHRLIIKSLISNIIDVDEKYKQSLLNLVHKKRYREIISILESISLTRELRVDESSILEITLSIVDIFETGNIPLPLPNEAKSTREAISYQDYPKALDLESQFLLSKNIFFSDSAVYFLLYEINKLMSNIHRLNQNNSEKKLPDHLK